MTKDVETQPQDLSPEELDLAVGGARTAVQKAVGEEHRKMQVKGETRQKADSVIRK